MGLEAGRQFGPRLEATVASLHHEHHLGYERVVQVCEEIFGVTLSKGGAVSIVERAGKAAGEEAETIGEQVRQSKVIGSDETSARVHGRNWREWVFQATRQPPGRGLILAGVTDENEQFFPFRVRHCLPPAV